MKHVFTLFAALLLTPLLASQAETAEDSSKPLVAALQGADDLRVTAMRTGDSGKLRAILSDELHYAHSSGDVDSKASLIAKLTSGKTKYLGIDYQRREFTIPAPGIALMTGRVRIRAASGESTMDSLMSFLAAWRLENGQWRFLAWQSCKLP